MEKMRSNYFSTTLTIFALVSIIFTFTGIIDQIAFAQEGTEIWLGPTTNGLTTFFSQVAE